MKPKLKKITDTTLTKWKACTDGHKRFNKLFPKGADLKTASDGLIADGRADWANWLWQKCYADEEFKEQTVASAGDRGTASAGYLGTASAGYLGTASAGDRGTASAGDRGTASAGYLGTAKTGKFGALVIEYYDGSNYRKRAGEIGPEGLKPETWYKLDDSHNFVEVPAEEVEKYQAQLEAERKR